MPSNARVEFEGFRFNKVGECTYEIRKQKKSDEGTKEG
jgi:hypothetical protein